jgi:hypothetical protein
VTPCGTGGTHLFSVPEGAGQKSAQKYWKKVLVQNRLFLLFLASVVPTGAALSCVLYF